MRPVFHPVLRALAPVRALALAPLVAIAIVVVFKAFLAVRIPGGAVYDIFPQALRNFLVVYL